MIDSAEAKSKWKKFAKKIGWSDEWLSSDLYYPWRYQGELWLTNFLFSRNISGKMSNILLQEFTKENIVMSEGPIRFRNICQLHNLLDVAANKNVVSTRN